MKSKMLIGLALAVCLCMSAQADLSAYSQDFEGLNAASGTALGDDGWLVGANVFDPTGTTFLYNYFSFPAPNGGPSFSAVTLAPDAVDTQGLVVYNDYNNPDHAVSNQIEAIFFREWTVGAADVGNTVTFDFDAKLGDLQSPTTANAFIKTLDPGAGFSVVDFLTVDTTAIPTNWGSYQLSLDIDASKVGYVFQIGFSSTASNYIASGVNYDNINLAVPEPATAGLMAVFGGAIILFRRYSQKTRLR